MLANCVTYKPLGPTKQNSEKKIVPADESESEGNVHRAMKVLHQRRATRMTPRTFETSLGPTNGDVCHRHFRRGPQ